MIKERTRQDYNKTYYNKHKDQLCRDNYVRSLASNRISKPRPQTLEKYGLTLEQVQDIVNRKIKLKI